MKRFARLNHVMAALVALVSVGAAHAGDVIGSSSAGIDQLRFRLIDLAPDDGITPDIAVNGQWLGLQIHNTDADGYRLLVQDTLLQAPAGLTGAGAPVVGVSPDGTINYQLGSMGMAVSSSLDKSQVMGQQREQIYENPYVYQDGSGQWYQHTSTTYANLVDSQGHNETRFDLQDGGTGGYARLTLSANTLLVIEGTALASLDADRSNLADLTGHMREGLNGLGVGNEAMSALGRVGAGVRVGLFNDSGVVLPLSDAFNAYNSGGGGFELNGVLAFNAEGFTSSNDLTASAPVVDDALALSRTISQNFAVSYANVGSSDIDLSFLVSLMTFQDQTLNGAVYSTTQLTDVAIDPPIVVPNPPVGSVPEPGTWALMGLGLAGLALARRRRQG